MTKKNVLVLGSGAREHVLAYKLSLSKYLNKLFVAPGNAGTSQIGTNLELKNINDFETIKTIVLDYQIDLVVIGPEEPLVKGITDFFNQDINLKSVNIIGPNQFGAKLEGSKAFSKEFMTKYNIPTAKFKVFNQSKVQEAKNYLKTIDAPYVIKANGLAAGKGVIICNTLQQAQQTIDNMLINKQFGAASKSIIIEQFLEGIELSVFILTDSKNYKILPIAKDYKRVGKGDSGPNTGGMGAISPPPFVTQTFLKKIDEKIIKPTLQGLNNEGIKYKGFLFIGLIKVQNEPYVIEYNVRMGDPEAEVVLPKVMNDFIPLFEAIKKETLDKISLNIEESFYTTVILASGGYPEKYDKHFTININKSNDSLIFHAGTTQEGDNIKTNGGRVLAITNKSDSIKEALNKVYRSIENINFEKMYFRTDIGFDLL